MPPARPPSICTSRSAAARETSGVRIDVPKNPPKEVPVGVNLIDHPKVDPVRVLVVPTREFRQLLRTSPDIQGKVLQAVAERMASML